MRNARGVVLLHVLIMLFTLAWISVMLLQWTLSRAMTAKSITESDENRAILSALQAKVVSCLSRTTGPASSFATGPTPCASPDISTCLNDNWIIKYPDPATGPVTRRYTFTVCADVAVPPCKIQIKLCPDASDCGPPTCTNPPLWQ
ncbi:MAG: hypothetical protein HY922_16655 [Elusimicrobia bacterium]|nr:hypothetical protein [Elusimicrobiota bacterium]